METKGVNMIEEQKPASHICVPHFEKIVITKILFCTLIVRAKENDLVKN